MRIASRVPRHRRQRQTEVIGHSLRNRDAFPVETTQRSRGATELQLHRTVAFTS